MNDLGYTIRESLQTTSALSATSKLCFEQPATSFLVCSLIFIEYQFEWKMESYYLVIIQATFLQSILLYITIDWSTIDKSMDRRKK
ncbi:S1 RNA-binding domain-containing protein [Streptococcus pneumoniae]|nr:S1 RNA-binding domain-containing protein [Streptococcus pneumoniae]